MDRAVDRVACLGGCLSYLAMFLVVDFLLLVAGPYLPGPAFWLWALAAAIVIGLGALLWATIAVLRGHDL